jgi:hypothetical protein
VERLDVDAHETVTSAEIRQTIISPNLLCDIAFFLSFIKTSTLMFLEFYNLIEIDGIVVAILSFSYPLPALLNRVPFGKFNRVNYLLFE